MLCRGNDRKSVVKEHLGDQGCDAGLNFFLQMSQVFFQTRRLKVFLRIAGAGNLQTRMLLQMAYQIRGIVKFTAVKLFVAHGQRPVSAQRKHVVYPGFLQRLTVPVQIFFRETNAGNVGDGINLQLLPDIRCDLYRLTRPGTARAVGTADKIRTQLSQLLQNGIYIVEFIVFLGREYLEGETCFVFCCRRSLCHMRVLLLYADSAVTSSFL